MNRRAILHDLETAPFSLWDELRRHPEYTLPAALVLGFVVGLAFRRSTMGEEAAIPEETENSRGWLLVEVDRLFR